MFLFSNTRCVEDMEREREREREREIMIIFICVCLCLRVWETKQKKQNTVSNFSNWRCQKLNSLLSSVWVVLFVPLPALALLCFHHSLSSLFLFQPVVPYFIHISSLLFHVFLKRKYKFAFVAFYQSFTNSSSFYHRSLLCCVAISVSLAIWTVYNALLTGLRIYWLYPLLEGKTPPSKKNAHPEYNMKLHLVVRLYFCRSG